MTQLIVDGFATYGTGNISASTNLAIRSAMLSGAWADVPETFGLGVLPFNPTDTAIYVGSSSASTSSWPFVGALFDNMLRRVLPGPKDDLIIGFRYAMDILPTKDNVCHIVRFMAGAPSNADDLLLVQQSNGYIALRKDGTTLGVTQGPVGIAGSAIYLEMQLNTTAGTFKLNVDDEEVMSVTGITTAGPTTQVSFIGQNFNTGNASNVYMTDLVIRDTEGTYNNALVGDRRVATLMVNRDDEDHQGWSWHPLQRFGASILNNTVPGTVIAVPSAGVYCAATTATDLEDGDFTIEGEFRLAALPTGSNKAVLFGKWAEDSNQRSYRMYLGGPTLDSGMFVFQCSTDGTNGTVQTLFRWPWKPKTGQWYHIAVSRVSGQLRVFIDGVLQGVAIADPNFYFTGAARTAIMAQANNSPIYVADTKFYGWQDEFRLTVGVGRYTANFAPPTDAFPRSALGDPDWLSVQWLSGWENGLFDDSSYARTLTGFANTGSSEPIPSQLSPDDLGFGYKLLNKKAPPLDWNFIEAALIPATGIYTLAGQPADTETVTLGTDVYTFKTVLASAYDVLIGTDADDTLINLIAAIMGGSGEGTLYGTGTLPNEDAVAEKLPTTQMMAVAITAGAAGNSIVSTTTAANGSWAAATLLGGADIPPFSQFGFERPPNDATVIDSVTLVMRAWKTDSGPAKVRQSFVAPAGALADGAEHNVSTSPTLYFDMFEEDPDTASPITPATLVSGMTKINRTV